MSKPDWADEKARELMPKDAFVSFDVAQIGSMAEMQETATMAIRRGIMANTDKKAAIATALREAERRGRVYGLELAIRIFDDDQDGDSDFIRFQLQRAVKLEKQG